MSVEYTPDPLLDAARHTPTALRNDSSDPSELAQSISFGGVGATCNPTIAYTCINQRRDVWLPRIAELAKEMPNATESKIGWQVVHELSLEAAKLLADQAEEFHDLAKNIIVKIPATSLSIEAIEDATYRGTSVNVTVSFSVAQAVTTGEAIEHGLKRREAEGKDTSQMGRSSPSWWAASTRSAPSPIRSSGNARFPRRWVWAAPALRSATRSDRSTTKTMSQRGALRQRCRRHPGVVSRQRRPSRRIRCRGVRHIGQRAVEFRAIQRAGGLHRRRWTHPRLHARHGKPGAGSVGSLPARDRHLDGL